MNEDLAGLQPATATLQVDNERVKVTRYRFAPRSETGWHRHGCDYVVVPTVAGTLTVVVSDGSRRDVVYVPGESYARAAGVEHNVVNLSGGDVEFVEIELK